MEIAVRKATRLEYRPPKQKHIRTLVNLTFHKPALIDEMLVSLARRGRENSWIIIFKVLIIVHTLLRQGNGSQTISRLEKHTEALSIHRLKEKASGSIQNLHMYHQYLYEKLDIYRDCGIDYIKSSTKHEPSHLRHLPVSQGLLRETRLVQKQIASCLSCKFQMDIGDNAISCTAYRLVVEDLLDLCAVVNEAVVNILEHYFTMSKADATNALEIYKTFANQMDRVAEYLDLARRVERELEISIPKLNHAPVSLVSTLEDYLNEENFEQRRQSIIDEQGGKLLVKKAEQPVTVFFFLQGPSLDKPTSSVKKETTISPAPVKAIAFDNPPVPQLIVPQHTGNPFLQPQTLTLYQPQQHQINSTPFAMATLPQSQPIFPINKSLKRSMSVSNNLLMPDRSSYTSLTARTSTLILPQSTGTTASTNPFRYSTLPSSSPTPDISNLHYKIPVNTRNPFAAAASQTTQRHSTNPFHV
ncbi:ANTH-domain-containing protein [Hesseltinella vesiculosa]|uniref:ANTH-domain-containing protein n=1 Tax=Hesseltinella vesiculosa TaxID=101127 RepID=A0A1X2GKS5_9FUNG|nr:ANTH-domain-containing protein [Hesseltinella vesiculosa]